MRHTISVLVENNIDSLNVAPTHDPSLSRITLVLNGDESSLDLCTKQLRKLVNVVEIIDFKGETPVARELVLVKVRAEAKRRPEIFQIIETFHATIVTMAPDSLVVEVAEDEEKVSAFLAQLEPFGIVDLARTGRLVLKR
jgi:acetolactate synthase-1/3 small subunit